MVILYLPLSGQGEPACWQEESLLDSCSHLHIYVENGVVVRVKSSGPHVSMSEIELGFLTVNSNPQSFTGEFLCTN